MKNFKTNEIGITLVGLVVTIIILLILSGISVASLTKSGLFENARLAKEKHESAQEEEKTILADYEGKLNEYIDGSREQITINKEEYTQLLNRVEALEKNVSSNVGEIYTTDFSNLNVTGNQSNTIASITLPSGKYVLVGYAIYEGSDFEYTISLINCDNASMTSGHYAKMSVTSILEAKEEKTYFLTLYPSKTVTLSSGYIKAIRIGD